MERRASLLDEAGLSTCALRVMCWGTFSASVLLSKLLIKQRFLLLVCTLHRHVRRWSLKNVSTKSEPDVNML